MLGKLNRHLVKVYVFLITIALIGGMAGCDSDGSLNLEIRDWYDLDDVRNNLTGNHILMNDLDSTSPGYQQLASPTANGGQGWEPIGYIDPILCYEEPASSTANGGMGWEPIGYIDRYYLLEVHPFTGTFNGQGYEIRDLFIYRPGESAVGLLGIVAGVHIENIGIVDANVTGGSEVGALAGYIEGSTVSNSYATGNITGEIKTGGLVGDILDTSVSNSYSTCNVNGGYEVGGLAAHNSGTVNDSYSVSNVTGYNSVGGLFGLNNGTVSNSFFTGSITGDEWVGGLVGGNGYGGSISNSYSTGSVTGTFYVGGLVGYNWKGTVTNSFWDTETSGQATSDGGTGKTTAEMQDIATFSGATWNILAVADPGTRNPAYIWNIVDGVTYPFLSWQS